MGSILFFAVALAGCQEQAEPPTASPHTTGTAPASCTRTRAEPPRRTPGTGCGRSRYRLQIIDEKPLERNLEFTSADDMFSGLEVDGFVAVYGIHFDTDKADLKIGASKTLEEVVQLLKTHLELRVEIQGHTDSTGGDEHNLDLSRRRAATVKSYLPLYGIAGDRLTTTGFGESKPVEDSATEEGRALNRRVELHRVGG